MDSLEGRHSSVRKSAPELEVPGSSTGSEPSLGADAVKQVIRDTKGNFRVGLDGTHSVSTPPRLGKLIRLALRAQRQVSANVPALLGQYDELANMVRGINCHKAVLFVRNEISYEQLVQVSDDPAERGYPEVIALANDNPESMMADPEELREYAEAHKENFPFNVHVFRIGGEGLVPTHSFLWLGVDETGREICFQKSGRQLEMPFEVCELKDIIDPYRKDMTCMFLILPVNER